MSGGELLGVLYEVLSHDVSVNWRSFPGLQPPRSDQWLPLGAFQMISNWTAILIGCQLCDFCCRHVRGHCHARHLLSGGGGGGGGREDGEGGQRKSCVRCSFHGPHLLWISEVWLLGQTSMIIMLLCKSLGGEKESICIRRILPILLSLIEDSPCIFPFRSKTPTVDSSAHEDAHGDSRPSRTSTAPQRTTWDVHCPTKDDVGIHSSHGNREFCVNWPHSWNWWMIGKLKFT